MVSGLRRQFLLRDALSFANPPQNAAKRNLWADNLASARRICSGHTADSFGHLTTLVRPTIVIIQFTPVPRRRNREILSPALACCEFLHRHSSSRQRQKHDRDSLPYFGHEAERNYG